MIHNYMEHVERIRTQQTGGETSDTATLGRVRWDEHDPSICAAKKKQYITLNYIRTKNWLHFTFKWMHDDFWSCSRYTGKSGPSLWESSPCPAVALHWRLTSRTEPRLLGQRAGDSITSVISALTPASRYRNIPRSSYKSFEGIYTVPLEENNWYNRRMIWKKHKEMLLIQKVNSSSFWTGSL